MKKKMWISGLTCNGFQVKEVEVKVTEKTIATESREEILQYRKRFSAHSDRFHETRELAIAAALKRIHGEIQAAEEEYCSRLHEFRGTLKEIEAAACTST